MRQLPNKLFLIFKFSIYFEKSMLVLQLFQYEEYNIILRLKLSCTTSKNLVKGFFFCAIVHKTGILVS